MSRTSHNSLGAFVSLFLASSCWLLLDAPALAAPAYTLIDLGTLGGSTSTGTAINANGYAVGSSTTSGGATHAFEYNPNTHSMTDLGTLAGQTSSVANDINDSNVIVGQSGNAAFRYDTVHGLVSMGTTAARGINSSGIAVGFMPNGGNSRSTEWDASNTRSSLFPASNSQAYSINDSDHLVGRVNSVTGYYSNGSNPNSFTTALGGFLPDRISNNDVIVGKDSGVAAIYTVSTATEMSLGKLLPTDASSEAFGINSAGTIVGTSGNAGFIWTSATGMQSLVSLVAAPGWTIISASDVNDNGQILAEGQFGGVDHAVILNTVPEPGSAALLAFGAFVLIFVARYRRLSGRAMHEAFMILT